MKNIKMLFEIIWKSIIFTSLKDVFTYSVILVYTVYYNKSYIFINMLISILFLYLLFFYIYNYFFYYILVFSFSSLTFFVIK